MTQLLSQVRNLEQANRVLEEQVAQLSMSGPSRVNEMYEAELSRYFIFIVVSKHIVEDFFYFWINVGYAGK